MLPDNNVKKSRPNSLSSILADSPAEMYYLDALRLSRMLEKAAYSDIDSKAKALGADNKEVERLKKELTSMAKSNPVEGFRLSRVCTRATRYLADSINKMEQSQANNKLPRLKPLYKRDQYMQNFDAGFDNDEMINSNVPNLFTGPRESLDVVIDYILDRCDINENCCLHLSNKSFNKKLNRNYKRIRPEDWQGRLKARGGLKQLLIDGSKYKPLEVLVVDELSHGYGASDNKYSVIKKANMCFNNATMTTCARGIVILAFQEATSEMKLKDSEAMSAMYNRSKNFECFSDENGTYVKDSDSNIVLSIKKA